MKKLAVFLIATLCIAALTACTERQSPASSESGDASSSSQPEAEFAAGEPGETPNGMTLQEIDALAKKCIADGEEVFGWYMGEGDGLAVEVNDDDTQTVHKIGRFGTIQALKDATEAVYTGRFCQEILYPVGFDESQGENRKFSEIDGALYINQTNGGMGWRNALTDKITVKSQQPDEIVLTVMTNELGFESERSGAVVEVPVDFWLLRENGVWKLDNWFQYGTAELPTLREKAQDAVADPENNPIDYTYDEQTGALTLPLLGIACTVPAEAMEQITLTGAALQVPSDREGVEETTIERVSFQFRSGEGSYLMFSLARWPAAEWDVPREYGPLPAEIIRSSDGQWVILHAPSILSAELPENKQQQAAMSQLIDSNEQSIVDSVQFAG